MQTSIDNKNFAKNIQNLIDFKKLKIRLKIF